MKPPSPPLQEELGRQQTPAPSNKTKQQTRGLTSLLSPAAPRCDNAVGFTRLLASCPDFDLSLPDAERSADTQTAVTTKVLGRAGYTETGVLKTARKIPRQLSFVPSITSTAASCRGQPWLTLRPDLQSSSQLRRAWLTAD